MFRVPARLRRQRGRHALVDGIPFALPVDSQDSPALMAVFACDAEAAAELLPGDELDLVRLPGGRALLVVTVIDYRSTDIGRYVEFSVALAVRRGLKVGQLVVDLPVSTEVSVKGGKGIWGMPKHRASLDFVVGPRTVSSQYDLDGRLCVRIEVGRPRLAVLPLRASGINFCAFRGMLWLSRVHFRARAGVGRSARLVLGDHPRVAPLHRLRPAERPLLSVWMPTTAGTLDDHVESWFLLSDAPPSAVPEGLETVAGLGRSEVWPAPPDRELVP